MKDAEMLVKILIKNPESDLGKLPILGYVDGLIRYYLIGKINDQTYLSIWVSEDNFGFDTFADLNSEIFRSLPEVYGKIQESPIATLGELCQKIGGR